MKYKLYYYAYIAYKNLIGKIALNIGVFIVVTFINSEIVYADNEYHSITEQEYDALPIGESYGYYGFEHISDAYAATGNMRVILPKEEYNVVHHQTDTLNETTKEQELPPLPPITGYVVIGGVVLLGVFCISITIYEYFFS